MGKHTADDYEGQRDNKGQAKVKNPRNSRLRTPPYRKDKFTSRQEWEYNNSNNKDKNK